MAIGHLSRLSWGDNIILIAICQANSQRAPDFYHGLLVWLDYDADLSDDRLEDVRGLISALAPGSILLVTLDADPKLRNVPEYAETDEHERDFSQKQLDEILFEYYSEHFGKYVMQGVQRADILRNGLPTLIVKILKSVVDTALVARPELRFLQLFNFVYADGAQMVTLGGLLDKGEDVDRVELSDTVKLDFVNQDVKPLRISVPHLTLREKLWLDQKISLPLDEQGLEFELEPEYVRNYKRFYRQYPVYNEALL